MSLRQSDSVLAGELRGQIVAIQSEQGIQAEFPGEVEAAAAHSARHPDLPTLDRTDLPLVTIDPPSARDLDQALHIARDGSGYVVHYAIADLSSFLKPGDPVDLEARRRGETLYGADSKVPLHPKVISEDAGSLLPEQTRPAALWTIRLDADGERTEARVERALVRSRAKLDYESVQRDIDSGTANASFALLPEVGRLRMEREAARGALSLPLPEQEIDIDGDQWRLEFRGLVPAENWNAQISLLTGFAAADLMVAAHVGLLRTLPEPDPRDVSRLRRTARGLGIVWAEGAEPGEFIRSLDPLLPAHSAMIVASTRLLRGSGYVDFDGSVPAGLDHAALAARYTHVTAPLRRLVDRFTTEICLALSADTDVPEWVVAALPDLPDIMRDSARRANAYENALVNLVEAAVLQHRVGEVFSGVIVDIDARKKTRGSLTIAEPAIEASVRSDQPLPLGDEVRARLVNADPVTRSVEFRLES